ncbi:hypothetical protein [Aliiroseovarius crassostreae]|uniref:hypothetical protein n=1 Tax=Aliiroseovarius crassostreae TaxID=154981 RepID=UPI0021FE5E00|nr:hypothetical protein [Aliiroseovarius crassostreae]UWP88278.1 hypothetical protein K3J57_10225 [Aliiroseovarius crassostreae]
MKTHMHPFSNPLLNEDLDAFLADENARVQRLQRGDEVFWAKKCETLSLKWRLQKGDPAAAFKADLMGLRALRDAGISVPDVIAEGEDFLVMRDSGPALSGLLRHQKSTLEDRTRAMKAAGRELALLHSKGLSHGRPAIKDMCWDGHRLTLLDFERFSPRRNTPKGHMQDLIIWTHSCFAFTQKNLPEIDAGLAAYRDGDQAGIWDMAAQWGRRHRWVDLATKPLQWGARRGTREFKAIPLTLQAFGVSR